MSNRVWVRLLIPYGYYDDHEIGDVIPIDNKEDVNFCIKNGIAEIVETEEVK